VAIQEPHAERILEISNDSRHGGLWGVAKLPAEPHRYAGAEEDRAVRKLACVIALAISLTASGGHGVLSGGTIKIVVPFAAGGVADTLARLLAEQIVRGQGPTSIIENRPGANGVIGTEVVARAEPNGSTVLLTPNAFLVNPQLRKVNYDALADFEPVCYLTRTPTVLVVNADLENASDPNSQPSFRPAWHARRRADRIA
jgi:Tripartite tricarboxylate transporter family receptor